MSLRMRSLGLFAAFASVYACDNANVVARRVVAPTDGGAAGVTTSGGAPSSGGKAGAGGRASSGGNAGADEGGEAGVAGGAGTDVGGSSGTGTGGNTAAGSSGSAGAGGSAASSAGTDSSGGDGNATAGGEGGSGGVEPPPSPVCDDGNACTLDAFVNGACTNEPLSDGTRCDDADLCTLGDRCVSGQCVSGTRATGPGTLVGHAETYGTGLAFSSTPIVTPGDNRFVFIDRVSANNHVTLAEATGGGLLKRSELNLTVDEMYPAIGAAWGDLVAMIDGASSIILFGGRELQLLSIAGGTVTERGRLTLPGSAMASLAGRGDRLFICYNSQFLGDPEPSGSVAWIDVSDPDAPAQVTSTSFGDPNTCGSLVVSDDGNRVYVNTTTGVRRADLSEGGNTLVFEDPFIVPSGLHLRGNRLLARADADLRLFDEASQTELARFSVPGASAAGLGEQGIFVQGSRAAAQGGTEHFAAYYDFSGSLIDERTLGGTPYVSTATSQRAVLGAQFAFAPLNGRMFELTGDAMVDVMTPELGNPSYLFASDAGIQARSHLSSHLIDVADPTNPKLVAGGPHFAQNGINLDVSVTPLGLIPNVGSEGTGWDGPNLVTQSVAHYRDRLVAPLVTVGSEERLVPAGGAIELPGGEAVLQLAGDFLYRAELDSTRRLVRFKRWLVGDLRSGVNSPSLELELEVPELAYLLVFDVDPVARVALVSVDQTLFRIDLTTDPPVVATLRTATATQRVRVRGSQAVTADYEGITFIDLDSREEQRLPVSLLPAGTQNGFLAYDGRVAYLSRGTHVVAVRRGALPEESVIGTFTLPHVPLSLLELDGVLAAGSRAGMITFTPPCE